MTETYQVGKFYRVPTVRGLFGYMKKPDIWPVLGPWHDDVEHIGFSRPHYHFDFRFLTAEQFAHVAGFSFVLHDFPARQGLSGNNEPASVVGPVVMRRRKCRREMPIFPISGRGLKNCHPFPKLVEAFADSQLGPRKQCPHKGASLATIEPTCGVLVCPLHGLCFDATTGKAIPPAQARQRIYGEQA